LRNIWTEIIIIGLIDKFSCVPNIFAFLPIILTLVNSFYSTKVSIVEKIKKIDIKITKTFP
jgi:hypothetical protein